MSDLISRRAAIDALAKMMPRSYTPDGSHPADEEIFKAQEIYVDCIETLKILPSAQPERKIGQWIFEERKRLVDETDDGPVYRTEKWWSCSECGYTKGYQANKPSNNYCEDCGAKMLKEGE